ncbi:MAG TPA: hypothetical protein VHQ03_02210 [Candidatus Dormibacteraeota bacterium]|jgi:hypothetical protein|nr:hypothetical protein [Candidatus Dormibacteraeota bacterium]
MTTKVRLIARASERGRHFALCVDNGEYPASLEPGKLYPVIPERDAEKHRLLRIIDESGEDYLFPAQYFKLVTLPPTLSRLLRTKAVA